MQHSERETGYEVNVTFDGKEIPMVPFVKEVFCNVILGIAKTMRGYTEDTEIRIVVKKEK
ncbi:MAG: hypothetical protein PHQ50_05900 [Eubacteriales bacterium]|nr:hypothetical protein [Eubacteriales bacterium]MDD3350647.1 hypothetical protein [Eubacteriales bacterium]